MPAEPPPELPDRYRIYLPYLGWISSPLPPNVCILIGICLALALYGLGVACHIHLQCVGPKGPFFYILSHIARLSATPDDRKIASMAAH